MKTLHLNLKKKFFDMILSGYKKEEYREIKPFWIKQLMEEPFSFMSKNEEDVLHAIYACRNRSLKSFSSITFSNGMAKNAPRFEIEFKGISIGKAVPEWSDNWQGNVFVLKLGEIIEIRKSN